MKTTPKRRSGDEVQTQLLTWPKLILFRFACMVSNARSFFTFES